MSVAFALVEITPSECPTSPTKAANDNAYLHLVTDNTKGTCSNLSRSPAFFRLTDGGDLTYDALGNIRSYSEGSRAKRLAGDIENECHNKGVNYVPKHK